MLSDSSQSRTRRSDVPSLPPSVFPCVACGDNWVFFSWPNGLSVLFPCLDLIPERRAPRELLTEPDRRIRGGGCCRSWLYLFRISLRLLERIWRGSSSGRVVVVLVVLAGSVLLVLVLGGSRLMVGLVGDPRLTKVLPCGSMFPVGLVGESRFMVGLAGGSELPLVSGGLGVVSAPFRLLMDLTPAARTPEKTSGVVLFFMAARFCSAPLCLLSRLPCSARPGGEGGARRAGGAGDRLGGGLDAGLFFGCSLCPSALHTVMVLLSHIFRSVASSSRLLWAGRFCTNPLPDTGYGGECLSRCKTSPTSISAFCSKGEVCLPCWTPL